MNDALWANFIKAVAAVIEYPHAIKGNCIHVIHPFGYVEFSHSSVELTEETDLTDGPTLNFTLSGLAVGSGNGFVEVQLSLPVKLDCTVMPCGRQLVMDFKVDTATILRDLVRAVEWKLYHQLDLTGKSRNASNEWQRRALKEKADDEMRT